MKLKFIAVLCLFFFYDGFAQYTYNGTSKHNFKTSYGIIDIGPYNVDWAHIYTDRPKIIFNKDVYTTTNAFSSYNNDLIFKTKGTERLRILDENGNVGIGIFNPTEKLSVNGGIIANGVSFLDKEFGTNTDYIAFYREDIQTDYSVLKLRLGDDSVSNFDIGYKSWKTGEWFTTMLIKANGRVGIGTTTPDAKLAVNGDIHTQEVKVDMNGWSDFVFEKNYKLPALEEVEKHIQEKGHLQDIPSAKEVRENGIRLGEMNAKLLQKIEELTLYVIELKKENIAQENLIQQFKEELNQLKNKL
ncbi:hypothetical protein [Joostella sp. CR20]|uniref:hypothetical protein n=1 Tax=Joostella sp. CR20 TaxID=2804312 RepID=UPI00313D149B